MHLKIGKGSTISIIPNWLWSRALLYHFFDSWEQLKPNNIMEHSHLSNRLPFRQLRSFLKLLLKIHFTSQALNRDGKVRNFYFTNSEWNCAEGKIPWESQFSGWLENILTWFVMLSFWFLTLNCSEFINIRQFLSCISSDQDPLPVSARNQNNHLVTVIPNCAFKTVLTLGQAPRHFVLQPQPIHLHIWQKEIW